MARTYASEMYAFLRDLEADDIAQGYEPGIPLDDDDEDSGDGGEWDDDIRDVDEYGYDDADVEYEYDDFFFACDY